MSTLIGKVKNMKEAIDYIKKLFTSSSIWIFAIVLALVLLVVIFYTLKDDKFVIEKIQLPKDYETLGIDGEYVGQHLQEELVLLADSSKQKLNDIFLSDSISDKFIQQSALAKIMNQKDFEILEKMEFNVDIKGITISNIEPIKYIRKYIGKKDKSITIYLLDGNQYTLSMRIEENGEIIYKTVNFDKSIPKIEIINLLCQKSAVLIAEQYDPIISIISDYHHQDSYDEQNFSWQENTYKNQEKQLILNKLIREKNENSKWAFLIQGNIFEDGAKNGNYAFYQNALQCYENSIKIDPTIEQIIRSKIDDIKQYISTENIVASEPVIDLLNKFVKKNRNNVKDIRQLLIAYNTNDNLNEGLLFAFEKDNSIWKPVFKNYQVNIGTKGFAKINKKIEGDLKAPTGLFPLRFAFGYLKNIDTKLKFITLTDNDYWITDPKSKWYNKWVHDIPSDASKYEKMRRSDKLHKYGLAIGYNEINKPGRGSAITMHVERKKGFATAGCLSLPEENVKQIIRWLDPDMNPHILMGNYVTLKKTYL